MTCPAFARNILLTFLISITIVLYSACSKSSGSGGSNESSTGSLALGDQIVEEVVAELKGSVGLTDTQVAPIKAGALAGIGASLNAQSYNLLVDRNKLTEVAPLIAGGAVGAMDEEGTELKGNATKLIEVSKVIAGAVIKSIKGKTDGVTDDEKKALPGQIAGKAIGALDDGGVEKTYIANALKEIATGAVGSFDDAGFTSVEDITVVIKSLMQEATGSLDEAVYLVVVRYRGLLMTF